MKLIHRLSGAVAVLGALCAFVLAGPVAQGTYSITSADFVPMPREPGSSGNDLLDLAIFLHSEGGVGNAYGGYNGDDANTSMPTGNQPASSTFYGSYVTSFGDLRGFYNLNYAPGEIDELTLFVDVNETGNVNDITLDVLDIVLGYDQTFGDERDTPWQDALSAPVDVGSDLQNAIGNSYLGGSLLATLGSAPVVLTMLQQGGGYADWIIYTGINPFDNAYTDDMHLLINWQSSGHDNGGEAVMLSGLYSGRDINDPPGPPPAPVPEPCTLALLGLSTCALAGLRAVRRRKRA